MLSLIRKIQSFARYFALICICANVYAHEEKIDNRNWWDDAWWNEGKLDSPDNFAVTSRAVSIKAGDIEIPATIFRPNDNKQYPGVLFVHGRRGLDNLVSLVPKRLAARGFVVLAPDLFGGRFIDPYPIEHDPVLEDDLNAALDYFLKLPDLRQKKVCVYSHTRGGYYSLKLAVTKKRQNDALACYISFYPHMQNPNFAEPMQVYRYAMEADELKIPTLIFIGDQEQYQRRRGIEMAMESLTKNKRPAQLIIYPGVGRGFDFRPDNVRTFADDLAAKDAIQRATKLINNSLK